MMRSQADIERAKVDVHKEFNATFGQLAAVLGRMTDK